MEFVGLVPWRQLNKAIPGFPGANAGQRAGARRERAWQRLAGCEPQSANHLHGCYARSPHFNSVTIPKKKKKRFKSHSAYWNLNVCVDAWQSLACAAGVSAEAATEEANEPVCFWYLHWPGKKWAESTCYNLSPSASWPRLRSQGNFL